MNVRSASIALPTSSLCRTSPASAEVSTKSCTSASMRRDPLLRPRVLQDPVPHLGGEVQAAPVALEHVHHAQRVLVVPEAAPVALADDLVERLLAGVPERRMAEIVPEPDRLGQILVQPQRARDAAGDAGRLQRVRQPRPVVVAGRVDEDLRLVLQPAERLRVDDPIAVALERRAQPAFLPRLGAPARLVGAYGERREQPLLVLANRRLESLGRPSGYLPHSVDASRSTGQRRRQFSAPRPRSLAGSAITSISAIRPAATVKPTTAIGLRPGATTTPAAPFTIAGRANGANRLPRASTCCATAAAPSTEVGFPAGPRSARKTTSASSTAISPSKSPARDAARKASMTLRCFARS